MHLMLCVTIVVHLMENERRYSELILLPTFIERYRYLRLGDKVGDVTFGSNRYFNQKFYTSDEWRSVRRNIILRDDGCDLGIKGRPIAGKIYIHHIIPITIDDIRNFSDILFDPENLICVSKNTHDAIHYGDESLLETEPVERRKNDTCPWRKD